MIWKPSLGAKSDSFLTEKTDLDPPLNQPDLRKSEENSVITAVFRPLLTFRCTPATLTVATWAFLINWERVN